MCKKNDTTMIIGPGIATNDVFGLFISVGELNQDVLEAAFIDIYLGYILHLSPDVITARR